MAEVEIAYKGSTIASMNASGNKNLLTSGKYCEDNITVRYSRPSSGSNAPLLTTQITEVNINGGNRSFEVELPHTISKGVIVFEAASTTKQSIFQNTTTTNYIISLISIFPVTYETDGTTSNMIKAGCQVYRGSTTAFYSRNSVSDAQFDITIENNIMTVSWNVSAFGSNFPDSPYNFTIWELADS